MDKVTKLGDGIAGIPAEAFGSGRVFSSLVGAMQQTRAVARPAGLVLLCSSAASGRLEIKFQLHF